MKISSKDESQQSARACMVTAEIRIAEKLWTNTVIVVKIDKDFEYTDI